MCILFRVVFSFLFKCVYLCALFQLILFLFFFCFVSYRFVLYFICVIIIKKTIATFCFLFWLCKAIKQNTIEHINGKTYRNWNKNKPFTLHYWWYVSSNAHEPRKRLYKEEHKIADIRRRRQRRKLKKYRRAISHATVKNHRVYYISYLDRIIETENRQWHWVWQRDEALSLQWKKLKANKKKE